MQSANDLKQSMCASLAQMGDNHYQLNQLEKAIDYYKQALAIAHETAEPALLRRILVSLASSTLKQGDFNQSVEYYEQAVKAAPRPESREGLLSGAGEAQLLLDLGRGFYRNGDIDRAAAFVRDAAAYAGQTRAAGERSAERIENLARAYLGIITCGQGDVAQTRELCSAAVVYAQGMSDDLVLAVAQIGLGLVQTLQGQSSDANASLSSAQTKLAALRETPLEAEARAYLCWCLAEAGQPDAAIGLARLLPARDDGSIPRRVHAAGLMAAGLAQALAGQVDQARGACREALDLAQELPGRGDAVGYRIAGRALYGLGLALAAAGLPGEATASHRQALALTESNDDPVLRVRATLGMGEVLLISNPQEARLTFENARSLAETMGNPVAETMAMAGLGQALAALGYLPEAAELFDTAFATAAKTGDARSQCRVSIQSGDTHRATGQSELAQGNYQKALEIARAGDLLALEAQALGGLGLCMVDTGDPGKASQAIPYLTQALEQSQADGNRQLSGQYMGALGAAYAATGQTGKAVEQYRLAVTSAQEAGDRAGEGIWLGNLGSLYAYLDQPAKAVETFQKAIQISREGDDLPGQARLLVSLGLAYSNLDHIPDAIASLKAARALFGDLSDAEMLAQIDHFLGQLGA